MEVLELYLHLLALLLTLWFRYHFTVFVKGDSWCSAYDWYLWPNHRFGKHWSQSSVIQKRPVERHDYFLHTTGHRTTTKVQLNIGKQDYHSTHHKDGTKDELRVSTNNDEGWNDGTRCFSRIQRLSNWTWWQNLAASCWKLWWLIGSCFRFYRWTNPGKVCPGRLCSSRQ